MSAKLEGSVTLAPQRSQIAVVTVFGAALLGFLASAAFLWADKPYAWVPIVFTVATFTSGLWMWSKSHRAEAEPTKLSVGPNGVEIHTSAASFEDADTFKRVLSLATAIGYRRDLPMPDGLVSEDLRPIPNSEQAAAQRALSINAEAASLEREAARMLTAGAGTVPVLVQSTQQP